MHNLCAFSLLLHFLKKSLTLLDIGGGIQCTTLIGNFQYLPDEKVFGTDFFNFSYPHILRILAKFHGCIITNFETMTVFFKGSAHKMTILRSTHYTSGKYLK